MDLFFIIKQCEQQTRYRIPYCTSESQKYSYNILREAKLRTKKVGRRATTAMASIPRTVEKDRTSSNDFNDERIEPAWTHMKL